MTAACCLAEEFPHYTTEANYLNLSSQPGTAYKQVKLVIIFFNGAKNYNKFLARHPGTIYICKQIEKVYFFNGEKNVSR